MTVLRVIKSFLFIVSLIGVAIVTIIFCAIIGHIQETLFLPQTYKFWILKYPLSNLIFIYEAYFISIVLYLFNNNFKKSILYGLKKYFSKRKQKIILLTFIILNIFLLYAFIFDVTVISSNKIIDYSFLSPQGKQYSFGDIEKIETGVYGRKKINSFSHYRRGDFFYIIQLNDGTRIHLTDVGGTKNDEDQRYIIEKLDIQLVNMDISKVSSLDNFEYCKEHLAEIYTDKIRNIILNIK